MPQTSGTLALCLHRNIGLHGENKVFIRRKSLEWQGLNTSHLKILVLLFCQSPLGYHQGPQALSRHVSTLEGKGSYLWLPENLN